MVMPNVVKFSVEGLSVHGSAISLSCHMVWDFLVLTQPIMDVQVRVGFLMCSRLIICFLPAPKCEYLSIIINDSSSVSHFMVQIHNERVCRAKVVGNG
jgi:hypothetical protein